MTTTCGLCALTCALAIAAGTATAHAQDAGTTRVALAPLSSLGDDVESRAVRRLSRALERGFGAVPGVELIAGKRFRRALRKSRKPELRTCDGETGCLAAIGAELSCRYVVFGEVGGAGVVYLKVVDAKRRAELRSTTLELTGKAKPDKRQIRAAATRLIAPRRYAGTLSVTVDIPNALIYVDGNKVAESPAEPFSLSVGTHALRVTHPEYRDFIRFVDVAFERATEVEATLERLPVVASDLQHTGSRPGGRDTGSSATPWYRRWYTVAGFGAAVLLGTAIVAGVLSDGIEADQIRDIESIGVPVLSW